MVWIAQQRATIATGEALQPCALSVAVAVAAVVV